MPGSVVSRHRSSRSERPRAVMEPRWWRSRRSTLVWAPKQAIKDVTCPCPRSTGHEPISALPADGSHVLRCLNRITMWWTGKDHGASGRGHGHLDAKPGT